MVGVKIASSVLYNDNYKETNTVNINNTPWYTTIISYLSWSSIGTESIICSSSASASRNGAALPCSAFDRVRRSMKESINQIMYSFLNYSI